MFHLGAGEGDVYVEFPFTSVTPAKYLAVHSVLS